MPLAELNLRVGAERLPRGVRAFLKEARRRIERFRHETHFPAFVPGDYDEAYRVLQAVAEADLTPGSRFCEWGSGFGVVTGLAAMLDFEATGIEIEADLVEAARELIDDFGLPVEFTHGSFIPRGAEAYVEAGGDFAWLTTDVNHGADPLELAPDDFDVIFAYPWPDEEQLAAELFEHFAAEGAVLITHHACGAFVVRQKVA